MFYIFQKVSLIFLLLVTLCGSEYLVAEWPSAKLPTRPLKHPSLTGILFSHFPPLTSTPAPAPAPTTSSGSPNHWGWELSLAGISGAATLLT